MKLLQTTPKLFAIPGNYKHIGSTLEVIFHSIAVKLQTRALGCKTSPWLVFQPDPSFPAQCLTSRAGNYFNLISRCPAVAPVLTPICAAPEKR